MNEKDYREFEEGKYPAPSDRKRPKDFPPIDELFTYGVDFPLPTDVGGLRCKYNEDGESPLDLLSLDGFAVPPLGITVVGKHGSGHARGFIYPPGTFRLNEHTIGLAKGATQDEMVVAKAEKKVSKIVAGVQRSLEKHDYIFKMGGEGSDINTLDVLAEIVTDKIINEDSAREARMWWGDLNKLVDNQGQIIDDRTAIQKQMEGKSKSDLKAILTYTKEVMELAVEAQKKQPPIMEVIDGELQDVDAD